MPLLTVGPLAGHKPARVWRRRIHTAVLDATTLRHLWPAHERTIDAEGNAIRDSSIRRRLAANIGDRLIISNQDTSIDEVAAVRVLSVSPDESTRVEVITGELPRSRTVYVQMCRSKRTPRNMNAVKPHLDTDPNLMHESWPTEEEACAEFDRRITECGLFEKSFAEVRGFYLAHRPGRDSKTARIDRILIPGAKLRAAGWGATIGVEIKRSDTDFGAAVAQAIDYTYCNWNVGNYWMYCERIFLWPFAMPAGPLASVMIQNGVGVAFGRRYATNPEWSRPLTFRLERNNIVITPEGAIEECHAAVSGRKVGSR